MLGRIVARSPISHRAIGHLAGMLEHDYILDWYGNADRFTLRFLDVDVLDAQLCTCFRGLQPMGTAG